MSDGPPEMDPRRWTDPNHDDILKTKCDRDYTPPPQSVELAGDGPPEMDRSEARWWGRSSPAGLCKLTIIISCYFIRANWTRKRRKLNKKKKKTEQEKEENRTRKRRNKYWRKSLSICSDLLTIWPSKDDFRYKYQMQLYLYTILNHKNSITMNTKINQFNIVKLLSKNKC